MNTDSRGSGTGAASGGALGTSIGHNPAMGQGLTSQGEVVSMAKPLPAAEIFPGEYIEHIEMFQASIAGGQSASFEFGPALAGEVFVTVFAVQDNSGEGLLVLEPGQSWTGTWGISPSAG